MNTPRTLMIFTPSVLFNCDIVLECDPQVADTIPPPFKVFPFFKRGRGDRVCNLWCDRSDKQPDRVEISPEQLSDASTKAERLAQEYNRPLRVIGWYHSHPHITVWPSHVDVRTQAMYQMMDEGFIGLIFSVFNEEKLASSGDKQNRIQLTCFQSLNESGDDYSPQYARIEVPVHIVPSCGISKACMESLEELPMILCQEEEEAYHRTTNQQLDLITKMHNSSVFTKSISHIMEVMHGPVIQTVENRLKQNESRIAELKKQKEELQREIDSL